MQAQRQPGGGKAERSYGSTDVRLRAHTYLGQRSKYVFFAREKKKCPTFFFQAYDVADLSFNPNVDQILGSSSTRNTCMNQPCRCSSEYILTA